MEDIEFSVQISDRDWDCFFAECEECNLLPPSLAGVDDSGMSDIDDTGSILTKRVQKVNLTAGFTEADRPIDGPPDCEGSPVENYLSKHAVGGIESVLSGSEEDLHLQSVNIFFEGLKNLTEAERLIEPSQMTDGKKTGNSRQQAIQEEERCSDGQQASSSYLPKNIPKLNSLPASGETAVGKETMEPVDTISNINTMKKDLTVSNILFPTEPAVCNKVLKTNKSPYTETRLFIAEEACTETRVKEATRLNQSHDSPEEVVRAETTPHTDKVKKVDMCTPLDDVKQEDFLTSQLTLSEMGSADSLSNLKMVADVNPDVLQSDTTGTNKTASQESSPSASTKRKRRKKRRLSVGPAESVRGYERQVLVKQRDSEEEQYAWRGGPGLCLSEDIHLSEDINLSCLNEPQKNVMSSLTSYLATSHLPVKISAKDMNYLSHYSPPCDSQWQYLPESIVREGRCKATGSAENNATNNRSVTSLSQTDDSVMSAPNNNGNVAINLQPTCSKLHVEESTGLPVSFTDRVTGKYNLATETCGRKDTHAWSLQQSAKMNHSIICFENEQNPELCTAEVKSISILPSAESNDPAVEVSQYDKLSAAKSVLAVDAGNSGRHNHTLCQKEAEPQQQLEVNCQDTNQYRPTPENTHFPLSASSYDIHNTKPKQFKTKACPFLEVISSQVGCAESQFDTSDAKIPSNSDIDITAEQTEHPMVRHTLSKFDGLSEKNTTDERAELAASQVMAFQSGNPFISGEINQTGKSPKRETKSTMSEDKLPTSPSDITPVSSCCTLNTESIMSRSNENITDLSESSPVSVNQIYSGDQREKTSLVLAKHEEREDTSEPKSLSIINDTTDSKCYSVVKAEDAITTSKAECEPEEAPDSKHSVFAISSFWSEMEKLTINDILGLRMMGKAPPPSLLPSLQESEETDMFAMLDSGGFTQLDESKPEQTDDDTFNDPNSVESSTGSVVAVDSYSSRGLTWESIGTDIYSRNMMLTSVGDISQPVLPGGAQTGLRKISKNVSVHNLHALASESIRRTRKGQTLQPLDEEGQTVKNLDEEHQHLQNLDKGELQNAEYFTDGHMPKEDKDGDTFSTLSTDGYRISLKNIFQYLFSGKQSIPSQSATDDINTWDITGNSVPETYDYFFSEFDTESFFCPLITAEDQTKDTPVPIFSYSRSANRNLQFPEAYDHFFASSSSDDSSVESDEEESCGPVRVVTRSSHTLRTSQSSTDIYENFFTDSDLRQNFFWKTTLSFRNIRLIGSTVQEQTLSKPLSRIPVRQSGRPLGRTVHPTNALGNQDVMFPDPLLYHLEDRIYTQLAQQSFRYEDLQTAVSNPRLDTSFLPLRQSDMCLVCIAFASWVLKTANPQVGDTWKAVLLANVSALSAIRYLRKYVKLEAAASEEKLNYTTPSDS